MPRSLAEGLDGSYGHKFSKDLAHLEFRHDIIKTRFKWSEDKAVDAISCSLCMDQVSEHFSSNIMGLDKAFEALEEQDVKVANNEQKHIMDEDAVRKQFTKEYASHKKNFKLVRQGNFRAPNVSVVRPV